MKYLSFLTALFLISTACTKTVEKEIVKTMDKTEYTQLVASVMPLGDSEISGSVTFSSTDDGVQVQGEFEGLTPGEHGFHIHQYGDCRADDGTSTGGHFNPMDNEHGAPTDMNRHMGDLGNIVADDNGTAMVDYTDTNVSLAEILGRGVIIHAGQDDLSSQPSGAAGSRVACGVIGIAQN